MSLEGNIKRRILLVDDEDNFLTIIKESLDKEGYDVECTNSLSEASQKIKDTPYHFYIFDLHIENYDYREPSATTLISLVRKHCPEAYENAWVVLTSDDENSSAFKAISDLYSDHVRVKDDFLKTIPWLIQSFYKLTPHNWELKIEDNIENVVFLLPNGETLSGKNSLAEVEEVLRLVLTNESEVAVSYLAEQGYSSSILLSAVPSSDKGYKPFEYVVKIADVDICNVERDNFLNYVKKTNFKNKLSLIRNAHTFSGLGGLLYGLVAEGRPLKHLYAEAENDAEIKTVNELVGAVLSDLHVNWYSQAVVQKSFVSQKLFSDITVGEMSTWFQDAFPKICICPENDLYMKWQVGTKEVIFNNPLKFIPPTGSDSLYPYPYCLVHGDFHLGNVLWQGENSMPIMIDFACIASGASIFCDFAKLEEHILLDLLKVGNLSSERLSSLLDLASGVVGSDSLEFFSFAFGDSLEFRKYQALMSEVRKKLHSITSQLLKAKTYYVDDELLLRGYHYALLKELVKSWRWLKTFPSAKKILNLMIVSKIIDRYCAGGQKVTAIRGITKRCAPVLKVDA